jgi:plasmid stabilization system protein ParE
MKKIESSALFSEDMQTILNYYLENSITNIFNQLEIEIKDKFNNLALFPESGTPVKIKKYNHYRWILVDKYYIFYTYQEQNDTVTIQRIVHTARNFKKLLEENL